MIEIKNLGKKFQNETEIDYTKYYMFTRKK